MRFDERSAGASETVAMRLRGTAGGCDRHAISHWSAYRLDSINATYVGICPAPDNIAQLQRCLGGSSGLTGRRRHLPGARPDRGRRRQLSPGPGDAASSF